MTVGLDTLALLAGLLLAAGTILRGLWRTARTLDRHMTAVVANTTATADLSTKFDTYSQTTTRALDELDARVTRLEGSR